MMHPADTGDWFGGVCAQGNRNSSRELADRIAPPGWVAKLKGTLERELTTSEASEAGDAQPAWKAGLRDTWSRVVKSSHGEVADNSEQGSEQPAWKHRLRETLSRATERVHNGFKNRTDQNDLEGQFEYEARSLAWKSPEESTCLLEQWEALLKQSHSNSFNEQDQRVPTDEALVAILRSGALATAVEVLARSPKHRPLLTTCSATGGPDNSPQLCQVLLRLLARASTLPVASIERLMEVLADVHKVVENSLEVGMGPELAQSAAATARWSHALLGAALVHWQETELLQDAAVARAIRPVLETEGQPVNVDADERAALSQELGALLVDHFARFSEQSLQAETPEASGVFALARTREALQALRKEREKYVDSLGEEEARCENEEKGCQTNMLATATSYRAELDSLRKVQTDTTQEIQQLVTERDRLQALLAEVNEKLGMAETRSAELRVNETRLISNIEWFSADMCERVSAQGLRQEQYAEERRAILSVQEVARKIESEVSERAAAVSSAAQELEALRPWRPSRVEDGSSQGLPSATGPSPRLAGVVERYKALRQQMLSGLGRLQQWHGALRAALASTEAGGIGNTAAGNSSMKAAMPSPVTRDLSDDTVAADDAE